MDESVSRIRDFYSHKPGAGILQREFGFYSLDRWKREGYITDQTDLNKLFGYEPLAKCDLGGLGWCEAPLLPCFEEKVLEDRGEHELVQDFAGRKLLCFKGRRSGFMPEYVDHPVKDMSSFEEQIKWRLDPESPGRFDGLAQRMEPVKRASDTGAVITQWIAGAYMYLRSLIGPEQLLFAFYDQPELIHACMRAWFEVGDKISAAHQKYVTFDEVFFGEDICYKSGPLISPDMIREFLFPYYTQLLTNIKRRQGDGRHMHIQIDTDGFSVPVIDLYKEIGMDYMSPFEAASGCDVVEVRKKYPELLISGGFDKRIMARDFDAIDREIERIMPFMKAQGGFIPTCDHGVPEEVSFENYMHFREKMLEYRN
jgi:Uroporphyrinogen-III decarboxylase